jgi:hypothetical protein
MLIPTPSGANVICSVCGTIYYDRAVDKRLRAPGRRPAWRVRKTGDEDE